MNLSTVDLLAKLKQKDRVILSRAITLIESQKSEHKAQAKEILEECLKEKKLAKVIGISGTPGVGKSTFLEALGMNLVEQNFSVAILSIDPSSAVTGGSILGDKTRMQKLSQHPLAYIRPSPSDQKLGGVARKTREVISLCHYFGFDYIFVESVGVGQSEADLAIIADIFTLLVHPGGGDDLQGMKRGILELVDFVIVNKADGDLLKLAQTTAHHYRQSLHILKGEDVPVVTCSSTQGSGIAEVAKSLDQLFAQLTQKGILKKRFDHRRLVWFEDQLKDEIWWKINHDAKLVKKLEKAKEEIAKSKKSISSGIDDFLKEIF